MKRISQFVFVVSLAVSAALVEAGNVWLDWTGAKANIDIAWSNAGYSAGQAMTTPEYDAFRANVKSKMDTHWAGFNATFLETNPGGLFETLRLGSTTGSSGLYGQAERLDWRNRFKDDIANLYLANFGAMINASTFTRAENLERLANAVAGTASHELGHNCGLQHYDCYGQDNINAPLYSGITGQQNDAIMATGSTGLTSLRRGLPRSFNPLETMKLEFADGFAPTLGQTVTEMVAPHGSTATAQAVFGTLLPISGRSAVNIDGGISANGQADYYSFQTTVGSLIVGNIFSSSWETDTVDTVLTLYNNVGTQVATNNNIAYTSTTFGGSGTYSTDSIILNFQAAYSGVYYMAVRGNGTSTGNYELLLAGANPVPEPATMLALGAGVALLLRRRRRLAA
ncbi:MAG: PEP-CTERM sorting domain-containing protein [Fimbriimonadaceae bacterium]